MSAGDSYREKAAEIAEIAGKTLDPIKRVELEALRASYLRLALQADKNAQTDIVYQPPTPPERPVVQQQQQGQQKEKKPKK